MILLDSSFIIAYSNERDENHSKAIKIAKDIDKEIYGLPVINDYVFDEVITVMLFKIKKLKQVLELGEKILEATMLINVDNELFNLSWKIFKEQNKPKFSFTDCTIIATCRRNGISKIATFDEDFHGLKEFRIINS
ncbi:MAG: PIN domain-containing protein [Candidatus Bathyarchaeia archaeon]